MAHRGQIEAVLVQGRLRLWQGWPVDWDARSLMEQARQQARQAVSAAPIQRLHPRRNPPLIFQRPPAFQLLHLAAKTAVLSFIVVFGAAFVGVAIGLAISAMVRTETQIRLAAEPQAGVPLLTLERLTFRFVAAGFVLLTATLLAGTLFGEHLYGEGGSAWRWDHKRVFALLSWLTFAALLWGRRQWGWRGRRAVRVLYTGAVLLMLSYVGSRFVLELMLGRSA